MRIIILSMLCLSLLGCASNIQQLADDNNWRQIGYQDGIRGNIQQTYNSLSEYGEVNQADYEQGYLQGVTEYCNADFAYQMGLSGTYYEGVCEGTEDAQRFRMEWQRGWNEYSL